MAASIANATGQFGIGDGAYFSYWGGVFYNGGSTVYEDPNSGGAGPRITKFDLSRVNSLYSNDTDTLYPDSCCTRLLIRY